MGVKIIRTFHSRGAKLLIMSYCTMKAFDLTAEVKHDSLTPENYISFYDIFYMNFRHKLTLPKYTVGSQIIT